ncbi:MAG: hypothetical protein KDA24_08700 [Deltaproteobacteria bacterium]|nr:hypothetical protein [Deltaproteobacteria bacterium]
MSIFAKWSEAALPGVRQSFQDLATAGPVSTESLFLEAHLVGPLPVDVLQIDGRDRVRFLHAMLSNDIVLLDKAGPGHGVRATLNSVQGRLVADAHIYLVDGEKKTGHMLGLFERGASAAFVEMLDKYVIAEKVYFEVTDHVAFAVVGPGAGAALASAGAALPEEGEHRHCASNLGDVEVTVIRRDLGVPESFVLVGPAEAADALAAALGLPSATPAQLEAARIESALPRPGGDVTSLNIVLEGGLKDRAVSFTKGCYIGQEVICRLDSIGTPARLLVQLQADVAPAPGTELFNGGKNVGYVTSAVQSARLGGGVFLGYVKKRSNEVGMTLAVGEAGGPEATIRAHV